MEISFMQKCIMRNPTILDLQDPQNLSCRVLLPKMNPSKSSIYRMFRNCVRQNPHMQKTQILTFRMLKGLFDNVCTTVQPGSSKTPNCADVCCYPRNDQSSSICANYKICVLCWSVFCRNKPQKTRMPKYFLFVNRLYICLILSTVVDTIVVQQQLRLRCNEKLNRSNEY